MSIVSQPAPEGVHVVVCDGLAVLHRQRPAHVLVEDVEHLQTVDYNQMGDIANSMGHYRDYSDQTVASLQTGDYSNQTGP